MALPEIRKLSADAAVAFDAVPLDARAAVELTPARWAAYDALEVLARAARVLGLEVTP